MARTLRCHAEGREGAWEAICLDLDIAVQGKAFDDVFASLNEAISLYVEAASDQPESERAAFLHRPAPLAVRTKFLMYALRSFVGNGGEGEYRHQFTLPCAA